LEPSLDLSATGIAVDVVGFEWIDIDGSIMFVWDEK